ncbi:MAG: serine hydrolase domain-containing protein [Dokdonella sp.]|uniref:serine hydrolase domain-containing protein n=1 Tax=Dokdonella sp. TaxID=2291710 RepID=UPI003F81935A
MYRTPASFLFRPLAALAFLCAGCANLRPHESPRLDPATLDRRVESLMARAHVPGLALAVIRDGRVAYAKAYGERDTQRQLPLETDTVMYAASLTKATFAYGVMMMADEGQIDLDRPIDMMLAKPLPEYEKYADLAGDERWRALTPRILLSHRSGFANFRYWQPGKPYDPDGKLFFYFDPGTRFAYSGEGINLLQFALENGAGIDVGDYLGTHVIERFGMTRTSLTWREDFAGNVAIGYDEKGQPLGHKQRGSVRAAGSMDTTVADYARLLAAMVRGEGLAPAAHAAWQAPQVRIRSERQFPTMGVADTDDNDGIALSYALGIARYESPRGLAWFKGGHDDGTNNLALCLARSRDCVLLMSNSSNGESIFPHLIEATLGPVCFPWYWESYVPFDHPEWAAPDASHAPCRRLDEVPR